MKISLYARFMAGYALLAVIMNVTFFSVFKHFMWNNAVSQSLDMMESNLSFFQECLPIAEEEKRNALLAEYSKENNISILIIKDDTSNIISTDTEQIQAAMAYPAFQQRFAGIEENISEKGNILSGVPQDVIVVAGNIDYAEGRQKLIMLYDTSRLHFPDIGSVLLIPASLSIVFAILLAFWFDKRINKPLIKMNRFVENISKGRYYEKIHLASNDDFRKLSDSFNEMTESLIKYDSVRRNFIASVTHELRTPLTSISGFLLGMIDGTVQEKDRKHYLSIALDETKRLSVLIDQLLDISKIHSGKFEMNYRVFDICELIRRALISFEMRINEKQMEILVDFPQEKVMVHADNERIQQVILNLLDNAIKFSPQKAELKISVTKKMNKAYVSVKDQGPGIKPEEQNLIWDMFYTGNKSRTAGLGYGLGLSIIKAIIEQHNQQIYIDSKVGEGTNITFTLELC